MIYQKGYFSYFGLCLIFFFKYVKNEGQLKVFKEKDEETK